MGLAGAILYLSLIRSDEHRRQLDVASASGVTEVTLRNRCKELNIRLPNSISITDYPNRIRSTRILLSLLHETIFMDFARVIFFP